MPTVDDEDGARESLCVALHFRGELTDLAGVREVATFIGDDSDRDRHERHAMQLPATILPKIVSCAPILLRILKGDERIEDRHDLLTGLRDGRRRNNKDEVVTTDMPNEPGFAADALHDVVEDLRQYTNDTVAIKIAIPVVVFLEMIEVGVANGKGIRGRQATRDLRFDARWSRQTRRGMHVQIAI